MIGTTTLTSKGQIVIPKSVRDAMKLTPRQVLRVTKRSEGGKTVAVVEPVGDISELARTFKPKRKALDPVKIRAHMEKRYART